MNTRASLEILLRFRRLVAAFVAAGLVFGLLYVLFRPPQYTATSTLYVSAQATDSLNAAYQGSLLSQQRVKSYTQLITSPRILDAVSARLNVGESDGSLADRVAASSSTDSVLITVSATDSSAQRARDIVDIVDGEFIGVVDELERPSRPTIPQSIAIKLVQPPITPATTSYRNWLVVVTASSLIGFILGATTALVYSSFSRRLRGPQHLSEILSAPNLASIPADRQSAADSGAVITGRGRWAEAFRQLRTNIQFIDVDRPRTVLLVTSALPGEGKTTCCTNLAFSLAAAGERVLVIDADLRRPRVGEVFSLDSSVGLTSVLTGRSTSRQATQVAAQNNVGIDVLTSGPVPPNPSELLSSQAMRTLLESMRTQYSYVVIDTPPLLPVTDAAALSPSSDGVLLACNIGETRTTSLLAARDQLTNVSTKILGCVSTMVREKASDEYYSYATANTAVSSKSSNFLPGELPTTAVINGSSRRPAPYRRAETK